MFVHRPNTAILYYPMGKPLSEVKKDATNGILDAFDHRQKGWRQWDTDGNGKITRGEVSKKLDIVIGALPPAKRYEAAVAIANETAIIDNDRFDSRRMAIKSALCFGLVAALVGLMVFLAPYVAVGVMVGLGVAAAAGLGGGVFCARESDAIRRQGVVPARKALTF